MPQRSLNRDSAHKIYSKYTQINTSTTLQNPHMLMKLVTPPHTLDKATQQSLLN